MEYRKVQELAESSLAIILPKEMCKNLGIGKGDYVKVRMSDDRKQIIIEKAVAKVFASVMSPPPPVAE